MDNLGTEVSNKIRSAIKAKLIELDAYVDDELPDYIMVMVANDRTKEQMEDDLGLFLSENTIAFTTWLHNVLDKLRKVTLDEVAKKDASDKKKKKKKEPKKKEKEKEKEKKKIKTKEKDKEKDKEKKKKVTGKEEKNANKIEIGSRVKKTEKELSDREDKEESYDAEALLKKAVKTSAKSLKVNPIKKTTPTKKIKKKKLINLKEDQEFYQPNKISSTSRPRRSRSRSRSRSFSMERKGSVASQVQIVKRSSASMRSRSRSYERRSVASKAILPPRPSRPVGKEERGVARMLSRSVLEADRSVRIKRLTSPPAAYRHTRSPSYSRSPVFNRSGEKKKRGREDHKERRVDKERDEARKLKREVDLLNSRQLAMDRELEKLGRVSSLDRELKKKREEKKRKKVERIDLVEEDEDEVRIIVRRDDSEKELSEKETVEEEVVEEERDEPSPPKKQKKSLDEDDKEVQRLEMEDAELLEMRRKALESLMRKREEERLQEEKEETRKRRLEHAAREGNKFIIPLNDNSSSSSGSSSETSSDTDSEVSLSDVEDRKKRSKRSATTQSTEKEAEPTFIVTMDGIDEQYFKGKKDGDKRAMTEPAKQSAAGTSKKSSKATRSSPEDDSLELHPDESFDSPGQSPKYPQTENKKSAKVSSKPGKLEVKADSSRTSVAKPPQSSPAPKPGPVPAINADPRPLPPVKTTSSPTKSDPVTTKVATKVAKAAAVSKPAMVSTAPKSVSQSPVIIRTSFKVPADEKPAVAQLASVKKPAVSDPAAVKKPAVAAAVKKIAAVKPSVNKPVDAKIAISQASEGVKPKPKFTPISAPKPDTPATVISLKPKFRPVSFSATSYVGKGINQELCKYYPNCVRGGACFYFHPTSPTEILAYKSGSKFKWSAR